MTTERTLRCYDYVNQPFDRVQAALRGGVPGVFSRATTNAAAREHVLGVQLHVRVALFDIATDVRVEVGAIEDTKSSQWGYDVTIFPITWSAVATPSLFPRMKAKLLVYPLSRFETQLEFEGTYDPPLGLLGDAFDSIVGHRIAEASTLHFLREVATLLRSELAASVSRSKPSYSFSIG